MTADIKQIKQQFGIIGNDLRLNEAIRVAYQVAPTDMSVLVMGESGVGKEFFPKIIHAYSRRKHGRYIAVNCGAIPEGTIDSELFGHKKGAFTGAIADRKGYFEEANGGTIFLDEIGELPLATQARLLRVLESGEFIPVGASMPSKTDVRIVAATNVKLREAVAKGRFREDLYYRLNTVPVKVPSLRERAEDIPLLFRRFAGDNATKYGIPPIEPTEDALDMLKRYPWPGNIRELRNLVDRVSLLEADRRIDGETLGKYLSLEPTVGDLHPVPYRRADLTEGQSFANEREILYTVLFDMQRKLGELTKQVNDMKGLGGESGVSRPVDTLASLTDSITDLQDITAVAPRYETAHLHPEDAEMAEVNEEFILDHFKGMTLEDIERKLIMRTLERNGGVKARTAEELGIADRTLSRRLKEYEVDM